MYYKTNIIVVVTINTIYFINDFNLEKMVQKSFQNEFEISGIKTRIDK